MTAKWGDYTEQRPTMYVQGLNVESSAMKESRLGLIRPLDDGRIYVYCKAGSVDLAAGCACTFVTTATNEQTVATAAAQGDKTVYITAAGITANLWRDGNLVVTAGTGIGEMYKIRANTATSSGVVTVQLYDQIDTAWVVTDTDISVWPNLYNGVVVNPVDGQQKAVVVPQRPVTATYYFWGLARGYGALIMDIQAAAGLELDEKRIIASTNTAGYGMITTTPADEDQRHVLGYVIGEEDITANEAVLVDLRLI